MKDDEFWSATDQLKLIHQWARAKYAAPWAVLGAVLLRVAASTGPHVQLPGVIGGPASLNLLAAFVSASGGGKGVSDKVARAAWPTEIHEEGMGSGEGIADLFKTPAKEGDERVTRAIISVAEIDTLTGLAQRQGNTVLATLKAAAMGERLGSKGASAATSRMVPPHSYRMCLSVGGQPGHTGVIFNDATGGAPQRFLWFLTTDEDMPEVDEDATLPEPLNTNLPAWARVSKNETVVEIEYGPPEIRKQIVAAHLARQRGEGDALDGHWMLTRCKVAAVLAILHHRMVVSDRDWQLSEQVMAVSDCTRDWILSEAKKADRAKVRDRAMARAAGEEFVDHRRLDVVKRRVLKVLEGGDIARGELRARMGKREYRELLESAVSELAAQGLVDRISATQGGERYMLVPEFSPEPKFRADNSRSEALNHEFSPEPDATAIALDSHRSHDSDAPKMSAREWFANHIGDLCTRGRDTVQAFAVYQAGMALGYNENTLKAIASESDLIHMLRREGRSGVWCIRPDTCGHHPARTCHAWLIEWFPANSGPSGVAQADVVAAGAHEPEDYTKDAILKAKQLCPQIVSTGVGRGARWVWSPATEGEVTA